MAGRPIIIIKKQVAHAGHHGGAWKVAYADFVTAMMSLFIVLWLLNSSKQIQEAVGGYFKDPSGKTKMVGSGTTGKGQGETIVASPDNMAKLREQLQSAVQKMTIFDKLKNQIEMTITAEGLRIELLETEKGTFFASGAAEPSDDGKQVMDMLANELGQLPNKITIEGHTDAKPYVSNIGYSNWELSADRANGARKVMQQKGLGENQVTEVRGFADQRLRNTKDPEDPANRRISVVVRYIEPPAGATQTAQPGQPISVAPPGQPGNPVPPGNPAPPGGAGNRAPPAAPKPTGK